MTDTTRNPTMADVVSYISEADSIAESYKLRVLAALRRCKRLAQYQPAPLELIPADLPSFEKKWGEGRVTKIPHGFKTAAHFRTWRSEVRAALAKYHGAAQTTSRAPTPADDWSTLTADLQANAGVADVQLIGVKQVAQRARLSNVMPMDVTHAWLMNQYTTIDTPSKRRSFKLGWELIEKYRNTTSVTLPDLIPFPTMRLTRDVATRVAYPAKLEAELANLIGRLLNGKQGGHRKKHRRTITENTAGLYRQGVSYIYTAAVAIGHIHPDADIGLGELADVGLIEAIIETELDGGHAWQQLAPRTLNSYLTTSKAVFKHAGYDVSQISALIKDFEAFKDAYVMSEARRQWCKDFLHDRHRQRAFFYLPDTCFKRAKPMIERYNDLNPTRKKQAIAWAVAAAASAILTSLPLRAGSLISLEFSGNASTINIRAKGKDVRLTISGSIIKNRHNFEDAILIPKPGGDPKEILTWYIDNVRPLILSGGISDNLRNPDLLFCGIQYGRMKNIWCDATLAAGVDMVPHQVRHAIATVMANEDDADFSLIAALLGISEATVRKNYVFIDQAKKHQRGQNELARIQKNILSKTIPNVNPKPLEGKA